MSFEPLITCENLDAGYGQKKILCGVDLEIRRGEITVLLGGSGCGKSTLMKTIVGLLPPLAGRVTLFGEDLYALDPRDRARLLRRTGMLFQYGALFGSQTIYENIALPLREHANVPEPVIEEMVRMKLALVGLSGLSGRLPGDISGGQRKRVGLVRASILDPELIFADEPSAGLDPIAAAGLDELLRNFQRLFDMSMVVVTHELDSIRKLADRVVMLADGAVLAQGTLDDLGRSREPMVRDFFDRVAPEYAKKGGHTSVLDAVSTNAEAPRAPRH